MSEENTTTTAVTPAKRERKQTTFFSTEEKASKASAAVETQQGQGITLGEYTYFVEELTKLRGDDEVVKALHQLLYNNPGKKLETKKNLRAFNGFPESEDLEKKFAKVVEKKKLWTVSNLKVALGLFGLEKGGDREALCKRLVDYLAKPVAGKKTSATPSSSKKRKGKGAKKSSQPKKKRALSAFMLFSQATRNEVKEKNPELSFTDIGRELGRLWNALGESEKKVSRKELFT